MIFKYYNQKQKIKYYNNILLKDEQPRDAFCTSSSADESLLLSCYFTTTYLTTLA